MKWLVILGVLAGLYGLHRLCLWLQERGWLYHVHKKPSLVSLGRVALELQQMTQPEKRYLLEVRQKQQVERDDRGGPDKAGDTVTRTGPAVP